MQNKSILDAFNIRQ